MTRRLGVWAAWSAALLTLAFLASLIGLAMVIKPLLIG